jgi:hypothetical protein
MTELALHHPHNYQRLPGNCKDNSIRTSGHILLRFFLFPQNGQKEMIRKFTLSDRNNKCFEDRIENAYIEYCRTERAFPKVVGVSPYHANYYSQIMETRIDRNLSRDDFWLGVK